MNFLETAQIATLLINGPLDPADGMEEPTISAQPDTFLLSGRELARLRDRSFADAPGMRQRLKPLLARAEEEMIRPARVVTDKPAPPAGGSLNDYFSLAKYAWPAAEGEAWRIRDGWINPAVYGPEYDFAPLVALGEATLTLALAWQATGDEHFATRAATLVRGWFLDMKTAQTPHFAHAQVVPGQEGPRWPGLIEARNYLYVIDAVQILAQAQVWEPDDLERLRAWFGAFLDWQAAAGFVSRAKNNLEVWWGVQAAIYSLFAGRSDAARDRVEETIAAALAQIGPDGTMNAELSRARPYDYVAFNLLAMADLAHVGRRFGQDLWQLERRDGNNLGNALTWLRATLDSTGPEANWDLAAERLVVAETAKLRQQLESKQTEFAAETAKLRQQLESKQTELAEARNVGRTAQEAAALLKQETRDLKTALAELNADLGQQTAEYEHAQMENRLTSGLLGRAYFSLLVGEAPAEVTTELPAPLEPGVYSVADRPLWSHLETDGLAEVELTGRLLTKPDPGAMLTVLFRWLDADGREITPPPEAPEATSKKYPGLRMKKVNEEKNGRLALRLAVGDAARLEIGFVVMKADTLALLTLAYAGPLRPKVGAAVFYPPTLVEVNRDPPAPDPDALLAEYRSKGLDREADSFALYRIIGADLPPRHREGQSVENLRFILEHEPNFEDCEKRWVLNRLRDSELEAELVALLDKAGKSYLRIPFDEAAYARINWRLEDFPEPGMLYGPIRAQLSPEQLTRIDDMTYHDKNLYVMNNNGARNAALEDGRARAKWILPWDGNCFLTADAWEELRAAVLARPWLKYFITPMARMLDNAPLLEPGARPEATEEPQILFRRDAAESFNPNVRYGRRPKVELFYRLGIPGMWTKFKLDPWEEKTWTDSPEIGQWGEAGWVARLFSGARRFEVDNRDRSIARMNSIAAAIDEIDERLLWRTFAPERLTLLDEQTLEAQAASWRAGDLGMAGLGRSVIEAAEAALALAPQTVFDKTDLAPSGGLQDYIGLDDERMPSTQLAESESDRYDRMRFQLMVDRTTALALAWALEACDDYARHGAGMVRAWFVDPETRMDPHLRYAQVRRGYRDNEGGRNDIIELNDLHYLLDSVRLLKRAGALTEADSTSLSEWLADYRTWLRDSSQGVDERSQFNHRGTFYDLQLASIAAFLGDARTLIDTFKRAQQRILQQFDTDGVQPFEMKGTLTQHYCAYNLQGWAYLATIGSAVGIDLWSFEGRDGRGLRKGFERFLSTKGNPWPDKQIAPFDLRRYDPLIAEYRHRYKKDAYAFSAERMGLAPVLHPHDGVRAFWPLGMPSLNPAG